MSTISVAIMARNSDDLIGRCLESVKHADEIIVVDTGSDDTTKEIALQYTDKVYDFWECNEGGKRDGLFMDFALARNEVLRHCTMSHVLTIDCDEVLSEGGMDYLRRLDHDAVAIWCVRGNNREKHQQPRFYANKPDIYWRGAAHNYLIAPPGAWTNQEDVHITYHTNKQRTKIDPDRTIRILTKYVKEHPGDCAREIYYLAKEHQQRAHFRKALQLYARYVKRSDYLPEKADAFVQMAKCYTHLKMYKDATNASLAAMNINPDFSEAYRMLGDLAGPAIRLRYQKMAAHATDNGVLFVRNDNRIKVTILTPVDAGDIAHTIMYKCRFHDPQAIDIEAVAMQSSGLIPSIASCGIDVVQDRVNRSDVIHFISNENHKRDFYGIKIPQGKKIVYTNTSDNPQPVHAKLLTHTRKEAMIHTPVSEFTTVNNIGPQWHKLYEQVRS